MFNLLRMDLRRLRDTKSFWGCMIAIAAICTITIYLGWFMSSPEFVDGVQGVEETTGGTVTITDAEGNEVITEGEAYEGAMFGDFTFAQIIGNLLVAGGLVSVLVMVFSAIFTINEFDSGFIKNIFSIQKNRFIYFFSKAITLLIVVIAFLGSGILAISLMLWSQPWAASSFTETAGFLALVILCLWAFAMIGASLAWLFRNKSAAIVVSIFIAFGLAASLVSLIVWVFPNLEFLNGLMLTTAFNSLGGGLQDLSGGDIVRIAGIGLAYLAAFSAIGAFALKKKDVA